ncbi:hypothetical protein MSG28_008557 [Choristoneura fumiferana]|uniref:Uncharacterized protein n=1 Tax=Choristoneura fumiferana TaxID=7141 RepID=A0ACC0J793_CHOFU|nr:hypothetical protein MSG28_008557 [Choristoneura fumiferana]
MDIIIKVNNQSNGRDKLARLFQYTSRLVWHQLEARNANKYSIDRIRNLELTLSSFRKMSDSDSHAEQSCANSSRHETIHECAGVSEEYKPRYRGELNDGFYVSFVPQLAV